MSKQKKKQKVLVVSDQRHEIKKLAQLAANRLQQVPSSNVQNEQTEEFTKEWYEQLR